MRQGPRRPRAGVASTILAETRLAAGLTQGELAERAGLSRETLRAAERKANAAPSPKTAAKIAAALGLATTDLWSQAQLDAAKPKRREPIDQAVVSIRRSSRYRLAYATPEGGIPVVHYHRPPICCGTCWCRVVNLSDPETYRSVEQPLVPLSVGHA